MVISQPVAIDQGWNADDVFPCVIDLYNATGGKIDASFATKFIANYKHHL